MGRLFASGDYLEVTNNGAYTPPAGGWQWAAGSIALWVNTTTSVSTKPAWIHGLAASSSTNPGIAIVQNNSTNVVVVEFHSGSVLSLTLTGVTAINDGRWHHICVTFNTFIPTFATLYVDGRIEATGLNAGAQIGLPAVAVRWAKSLDSFWNLYVGTIAHTAWWNRQLTSAEAMQLSRGAGPHQIAFGQLIDWWPLWGTGSQPEPSIVSNRSLTLSGTSLGAMPPVPIGLFRQIYRPSSLISTSTDATVNLTGVSATGQIGTVTPEVDATPLGVSATGAVGTVSFTSVLTLTGVSGTGQVGSVGLSGSTPTLSGVSATGAVGSITPSIAVTLTGVSGTGAVGTLIAGAVAITGVAGTGIAATLGHIVSPTLVGVAGTGHVGNVVFNPTVLLTGVFGTGQVGTVAPQFSSGSVALTGVVGTGVVGTLGITGTSPALTGVFGTGQVGLMFVTVGPEPEVTGWSTVIDSALIDFISYSPEDRLLAVQFQPAIPGRVGERITYQGVPYYVALSFNYSKTPDLYYNTAIKTQFRTA